MGFRLVSHRLVTPFDPPAGITHGSQLTLADVGHTAYFDSGLGRLVADGDLTDLYGSGTHIATDFVTGAGTQLSPRVITKQKLDAYRMDVAWVTLRASMVQDFMANDYNGTKSPGMLLDYVTCDLGGTVGDVAAFFDSFSMNRCLIQGQSDGVKALGGTVPQAFTECIFHDAKEAADDHNDCIQNSGGTGSLSVVRCQLYQQAAGDDPSLGSSIAQFGDFASSTVWYAEFIDCDLWLNLNNSNPGLRLLDGGLTGNITYKVTGCIFHDDGTHDASRAVSRGSSNITPPGQIEWSNNRWADDMSLITLS